MATLPWARPARRLRAVLLAVVVVDVWSLGIGTRVWGAALSRTEPVVVAAAIAALVVTALLGRAWEAALRSDLARSDGWAR